MKRDEVKTLVRRLNDIYDKNPSAADLAQQLDSWAWVLEGADAGAVMAAAKRISQTQKFYPKPAELMESAQQNGLRSDLYKRWGEIRAKYQTEGVSEAEEREWDNLEIELGMPGSARRTAFRGEMTKHAVE